MTGRAAQSRVHSAVFWTVADFVLDRGANFLFIVVLARLLTPGEFGMVALLGVFVAVAVTLAESGLGQALVQKAEVSDDERSAVFWLNLSISLLAAAAIVAAAPAIAAFFAEPELVPLARLMAFAPVLGALGTVQRARLVRDMRFRALLVVRIASTLIAGTVAVIMVLHGYGVYALAAQFLVGIAVNTSALWLFSGWRPRFVVSLGLVLPSFRFGGFLAAAALLDAIYIRTYAVIIGRYQGAAHVGHYARADSVVSLVTGATTYPIVQVALPTFSRMDGNAALISDAMRSALRTAMLINAPAMLGLAALAKPFMLTVYGPQWAFAAPILAVLCLGATILPVHALNLHVLLSLGKSSTFLVLEVLKKATGIAIMLFAAQWGAVGVAWGVSVSLVLMLWPTIAQLGKLTGFGMAAQLRTVVPILAAAAAMAAMVAWLAAGVLRDQPPPMQLISGVAAGMVAYVSTAFAFDLGGARGLFASMRAALTNRGQGSPGTP